MGDIAVLNREIAGANLARAVWDGMTSDDPRTVSAGTDLEELASTSGREFGVQGKIRAFLGAKSPAARAAIAEDLLDEIADASGITLDQSVDTNHMQSILVQHLPRVKLAVAQLQDALNAPASLTEEGQLAINFGTMVRAADELRKPLADLVSSDASGSAKGALDGDGNKLFAQLDDVASKIKSAGFQRSQIGPDVLDALRNANSTVGTLARSAGDFFVKSTEAHAASASTSLYWILALLLTATGGAIFIVTMLAKGFSTRLAELIRAMDHISRKDLEVDVPYLTDSNENGLIAQALARFKEAAA
jgi:methyl-accepting chemotaxis protein